ncbi:MAG: hypothetical protein HON53_20490 [Planctomycetaceae bacterium]|jgi:hypothetical protein|nr:hypothetical protein [Planctomycetaceae bacterium]MBT6155211.1 hypothetical protein [Planctomycetaceae bacterium]MBT6483273.1 hypothetical protein [Planctomycetaceae bacterium]MBT6494600.1 hypothetical protein [Planctomycetaceae bacterium]
MLFHKSLVALALSVCAFGSVAVAAPPSGAGSRGQSSALRGNERRALNSRQQLFDRAAAASQNRTIPTRPTASLPSIAQSGQSVSETARTSGGAAVRDSTARTAQTLGRGLTNRPATAGSIGGPQSATGRFSRDILPSLRRQSRPTLPQQNARRPVKSNTRRQDASNLDRSRRADDLRGSVGRAQRPPHSQADRILANRLADIDHMRDIALENGNEQMLQQADKLEQITRNQYQRRIGGDDFQPPETQVSATERTDEARANRFSRTPDQADFATNRRTDAAEAGDFNAEFGRQTAAAAREGREEFGRDMAEEGRARRSDITRGTPPERETRSRRTFGESIRNGLRRIGSALRLPRRRTSN